MVDLITITEPTSEPVTTAEVKTHCRVTHSNDDTYLDGLTTVARKNVETRTGFRLFNQTTELRADAFDSVGLVKPLNKSILSLGVAPIIAVTSIKYDDTDDTEQTLSSGNYWTDTLSVPARVQVKSFWPATESKIGAVRIRLNTGWASVDNIPEHFKLAVKMLIAHWYFNRTAVDEIKFHDVPEGINSILAVPEFQFYK